jgi:putative ATPase
MEVAYLTAKADAEKALADPVPLHLRNAVTGLMKDLDYGKGYRYAHDYEEKLTDMQCLPDSLAGKRYYLPDGQGEEADFAERLEAIRAWKAGK